MMKFRSILLLLACIGTYGCNGTNDAVITLDAGGKHAAGWVVALNGGSHPATYISAPDTCAECHGSDLTGGISRVSCFSSDRNGISCHAQGPSGHPAGWSAPASHGAHAKADPGAGGNNGLASCQHCHGSDFATVRGGSSCVSCHGVAAPHPSASHWRSAGTVSHATSGVSNAAVCAQCHNATVKNLAQPYQARFVPAGSFGVGTPGCFNGTLCHTDITRTSNCAVCHGPLSSTTFNSLGGATAPADAKVGAHVKHLNAGSAQAVACTECHAVPLSPAASGAHRDAILQVTFGTLARTDNLTPTVTRDLTSNALVCSTTYCHGASLSGGSNKAPRWNDTAYNAGCGTCHGYPPASLRSGGSHTTSTACSSCHPHVNSTNNGFTDPAKHINGSVEATGSHSFPRPGSAHRSAANGSGCLSTTCHSLGSTASTYPVTTGTPPNCRACHLTANPGTDPHCSDCHGDPIAGRPNGTAFPNRQGQHQRSEHSGRACTVCHPFSSGDTRHGWSNRQKSTSAQINTTIGWNSVTKSCSNSCHGTERWY